jgi:hypothetical protein
VIVTLVVVQDVNHQAGQPCRYPGCMLLLLLVVGLPCELRLQHPLVVECKDHHRQGTSWEIDGSLKKSNFIGELLVVVVVVVFRTLIIILYLFVCIFVLEKFSTHLLISYFVYISSILSLFPIWFQSYFFLSFFLSLCPVVDLVLVVVVVVVGL